MCLDLDVPFLGSLPLDPKIARCCDEGKDFLTDLPDSPAVLALKDIIKSKFFLWYYKLRDRMLIAIY